MCRKTKTQFCCLRWHNVQGLSYRRGNARRAMSVEILSAAVQLDEKSHFKRSWSLKVIGNSAIR